MGVVVKADCPQCDYKEEFYLGAGMLFGNPEIVKKIFDKETIERIDNLRKSCKEQSFEAEYVLAVCERCGRLAAVPQAIFSFKDGRREEFHGLCACGYTPKIMNKGKAGVSCPVCGSGISLDRIGLWD